MKCLSATSCFAEAALALFWALDSSRSFFDQNLISKQQKMSRCSDPQFAEFSQRFKKKQEEFKRELCGMLDDWFTSVHDEFAQCRSTSNLISKKHQSTLISVHSDTVHRNSSGNHVFVKTSTSSKQNTSFDKQSSSNKKKRSISIIQKGNVIQTGKIIKRYKIEKKSKVNGHILEPAESSSRNLIQATPNSNCENSTHNTSVHSVQESPKVETGLSESTFMNEMELNKAMFGVFFDGNSKYFVCDVEQHGLPKNKPYYKVYNVHNFRLYKKIFNEFSDDFRYHFIMPLKFDSSVTVSTPVLVVWNINDHYLTPATIKEVYLRNEQVVVEDNKGHKAVISIYDCFVLPSHMPIVPDVFDAPDSSHLKGPDILPKEVFREQPEMDIIFEKYAEHKQKYTDEKNQLDGVWRWADKIDCCSFTEPVDDKAVTANRFRSVWKNNRTKFSVGDNVVIWDSKDKPNYKYPIIGQIKVLYENIATKQKRVEFSWYLHPAEYVGSTLKPINVSFYFVHKYT